jgi:hypothetical protein
MSHRPAPNLHLIIPPETGEGICIIREDGERQEWKRTILAQEEWDYFDLATLHVGWPAWEHNGRYLGESVMRYLTLRMSQGNQPGLSEEEISNLLNSQEH